MRGVSEGNGPGMNINSMLSIPGHLRIDERTGAEVRSQVVAFEKLSREQDVREYTVVETHAFKEIRKQVFKCSGYLGEAGNFCGKKEAADAFALARKWAREREN